MKAKAKPAGLNAELEQALADELKEIRKKNADGTFVYGILDRSRVIDRCLKLEQIKQKIDSPEWGSHFNEE